MPHIFELHVLNGNIYKDVLLILQRDEITLEEISVYGEDTCLVLSCKSKLEQMKFSANLIRAGYTVNVKSDRVSMEKDGWNYGQSYRCYYEKGETNA